MLYALGFLLFVYLIMEMKGGGGAQMANIKLACIGTKEKEWEKGEGGGVGHCKWCDEN